MTKTELIEQCEQIFPFGSRVYGTEREDSDHDFVAVLKKGIQKTDSILNFGDYHYQVYTHEEFVAKIEAHDIQALECIFLPKDMRLKFRSTLDYSIFYTLNLNKLRESISTISNNSWVKCKKKLIISGDYDKLAALKSCFHSFRILDLGIQIARNNSSTLNYSCRNYIWRELWKLGLEYDADILWEKINAKYKSQFNSLSSEFKLLAPKDLKVRDKQRELKNLLVDNGIYTPELILQINEIFSN